MIRKHQDVRILEFLQKQNAITDNCKTDEDYQENGMTATDLSKKGLNKTQLVKHLPELKTQQLIIGKKFQTKGRPGIYYAITPIGSLKVFKESLNGKRFDQEYENIEHIKKFFPLIDKHWNSLTSKFSMFVYESLFNSIDRLEMRKRGEHYFSLSMTLQKGYNFLTFEKTYFLVTIEKKLNHCDNGITVEAYDPIRELSESYEVKVSTLTEIENDLIKFITFQFYYYLIHQPKSILKLIKTLKKGAEKNKKIKGDYHRELTRHARKYQEYLGAEFNFDSPKKIETKIIEISEELSKILKETIKKDNDLGRLIRDQKSKMNVTSESTLSML